jgi:archaellum biogenesis ATPase FlaH
MASVNSLILGHLALNEEYSRKVLPFIKEDYFSNVGEKETFNLISKYISKYNALPSASTLLLELDNAPGLSQQAVQETQGVINKLTKDDTGMAWLVEATEKFCKDRALYNAVSKSIQIMDGAVDGLEKGAIPKLLQDALAVTFDTHVGHDYLDDAEVRWRFYHKKEERIPFDLHYLNLITGGGLPKKTLNVILAGVGVGKTMFMCHNAAAAMVRGKNVLYITAEMAEEEIAKRIDANLLNTPIVELMELPLEVYQKKVDKVKQKTVGKLVIKEYPTATASVNHFRALLNELRLKRDFVPDIIFIDYLNICASSRLKAGSNTSSYSYIKAIAEELRGLAGEFNVPIVTATQLTRQGSTASDVDMTDTAESFGLPATADFMLALITTDELAQMGQLLCKQLKNRYSDLNRNKRFVIGVERAKMRFFDVDQTAQEDLMEGPVFDKSDMGTKDLTHKLKQLVE